MADNFNTIDKFFGTLDELREKTGMEYSVIPLERRDNRLYSMEGHLIEELMEQGLAALVEYSDGSLYVPSSGIPVRIDGYQS